jgi:ABC-type multidrug transport system fused ATPase/permease subunit
LLHGIFALPEAYHCYYNSTYFFDEKWHCSLFFTWFLPIWVQIIAQCFADKRKRPTKKNIEEYNRSPELESSYLNRLFFCWFDRIAVIGSKKDLTIDDLFELNPENKSECLIKLWNYYWTPKNNELSLIYTIFQMFKWEFISAGLIKAFTDALLFANPFLLIKLLEYLGDSSKFYLICIKRTLFLGAELWQGVLYTFLMFTVSQIDSLCVNYYLYVMFGIGTKIQTALIGAVYNKTLKLSNSEKRDRTGETVNLMAIDIERIQNVVSSIQQYWSAPFQITIALIFLYNILGISVLPGVFVMVTFIPTSFLVSLCTQNYITTQMKLKDKRIKLINEVLNGIKVVKLYNWELPMMDEIEKIRKDELRCNRITNLVRSILYVYNSSIPFIVALLLFSTYTLIQPENILTPQVAFISITLLNQLRSPLCVVSLLVNMTAQAVVSNKRLKSLLSADEIDPNLVERESNDEDESIKVENADFSWEAGNIDPTLKNINLDIKKGALIAVIGRVGSSKSSLISALLGEMEKLRGYVGVNGQVAYVPQQPWILNMSLRENITFGRNYVGSFYDKVIETCELKPDLAILPKNDQTEIGEKGINLSGGQKARVSLARAVYQDADVYLLDDPLSAVDSHVRKQLFNNVIGPSGMLCDKTRILVTHSITFLKEVDTIVHIDNGQILATGSYEELMLSDQKFADLIIEAEKGSQSSSSSGSISTLEDTDKPSIIGRTVRIDECENTDKLIQAESVQSGNVKFSVYWLYISTSLWLFLLSAIFYVFYASFQLGRNIWLSKWADSNDNGKHDEVSLLLRLTVYTSLGIIEVFSLTISLVLLVFGGLKASKELHGPILNKILKAPIEYFDTTPLGRILNRFGKDIDVVDTMLSMNFRYVLLFFTNVGSTIFVICLSTPIFSVVAIILILIYGCILVSLK